MPSKVLVESHPERAWRAGSRAQFVDPRSATIMWTGRFRFCLPGLWNQSSSRLREEGKVMATKDCNISVSGKYYCSFMFEIFSVQTFYYSISFLMVTFKVKTNFMPFMHSTVPGCLWGFVAFFHTSLRWKTDWDWFCSCCLIGDLSGCFVVSWICS